MGLIGALNQAVQGNVISPTEYNQNMDSIRDTFNSFAMLTDVARTVTVQHTFNPTGAPFLIGGAATGVLVAGLNSDQLDGQEGAYYQNASNLNAGTVPAARITQTSTLTTAIVSTHNGPHGLGSTLANVAFNLAGTGAYDWGFNVGTVLSPPANNSAGGVLIGSGLTLNKAATGTHNVFASMQIAAPIIGAGASTLTNAMTLYISGAPSAANNNYALYVSGAQSYFSGIIRIADGSFGAPAYAFDSEVSVGLYRAAGATLGVAGKMQISVNADAILTLNHISATGGPYIMFMQNGASRAFIQYQNGVGLALGPYTGSTVLYSGNAGSPVTRLTVDNSIVTLSGSSSDEQLKIAHATATGSPQISFYQTVTKRAYLQYQDTGDEFYIVNSYGDLRFYTGAAGVETARMHLTGSLLELHNSANDEQFRLTHSQTTGNPYLSLYQVGNRRAYLQFVNATGTRLVSELGNIELLPSSYVRIQANNNPLLVLNHSSATGNPTLQIQQDSTDRAYLQYDDAVPGLNIFTQEAASTLRFGTAGALRAQITGTDMILDVDLDLNNNDIVDVGSIAFNGGATITQILEGTTNHNAVNLAAGASTTTDITVTGAAVGDYVICRFSLQNTYLGLVVRAHVVGVDTVRVYITNASAAAIDAAAADYDVLVIKA